MQDTIPKQGVAAMSRKLIIYFSRSGATRALAGELAEELDADLMALQESRSRAGIGGYVRSLLQASRGVLPPIDPLDVDLAEYDLILLGTPVWAAHASCPMRRFLHDAADALPATAYFCTYGGRGYKTAFEDMRSLTGKAPIATLAVRRSDLLHRRHLQKLDRFLAKLSYAERWRDLVTPAPYAAPLHGH